MAPTARRRGHPAKRPRTRAPVSDSARGAGERSSGWGSRAVFHSRSRLFETRRNNGGRDLRDAKSGSKKHGEARRPSTRLAPRMSTPADAIPAIATATPYGAWGSVAVVLCVALLVVSAMLGIVRLVTRVLDRIKDPSERLSTYECGEDPIGTAWFRFNNRFTTVALTFLIFDVELALLWPILPRCMSWLGQGQGWLVFTEIAVFAGTLALGLAWVARRGGFVWDRTIEWSPRRPWGEANRQGSGGSRG